MRCLSLTGIVIVIVLSSVCRAQSGADDNTGAAPSSTTSEFVNRPNVITGSFGTLLLAAFADFGYERQLSRLLSVRAGYVGGWIWETEVTHGVFFMLHLLIGNVHAFEIGAGAAQLEFFNDHGEESKGWSLRPAVTCGYRYRPIGSWYHARLGASYVGSGCGVYAGIGVCLPDP